MLIARDSYQQQGVQGSEPLSLANLFHSCTCSLIVEAAVTHISNN